MGLNVIYIYHQERELKKSVWKVYSALKGESLQSSFSYINLQDLTAVNFAELPEKPKQVALLSERTKNSKSFCTLITMGVS